MAGAPDPEVPSRLGVARHAQPPPRTDPFDGRAPLGTLLEHGPWKHVPTWPGASQTAHPPSHAVSQQTPSAQCPLAHWWASEHAAPGLARGVQRLAAHHAVGAQSVSFEQSPRQLVAPHSNGAQSTVTASRHAPAPSHTALSLAMPFVQLGVAHVVDVPG
jgi:hypothetical protein